MRGRCPRPLDERGSFNASHEFNTFSRPGPEGVRRFFLAAQHRLDGGEDLRAAERLVQIGRGGDVLLQVLDDGRMTDGQGRTVDFKNTVIVMTSNLGSHQIQRMQGQEPIIIKQAVMAEVRQHFRPEFVNRIDEIVVFDALDSKQIQAIARIQLERLEQRLAAQEIKLQVSDTALAELGKAGFDPLYGARPLKRAIQQQIENPLAKLVLEGSFGPKDVITVDFKNSKFTFDRTAPARSASQESAVV